MVKKMGGVEKMDFELNEVGFDGSPPSVAKMQLFEHIGPLAAAAQSYSPKRACNRLLMSIYIVIFKARINVLLPFGPFAVILHYLTGKHGWVFFFSLVGIIPLAERLGYATEQLAYYIGPTIGGLLNATFGNATEMIISIYALKNGMIRVVQQSLLGSILSNMLLVLGCAFLSGGIVHSDKDQVFNKASAVVNSGLLLMAVMGLMFPAVLHFTHSEVQYGKSEVSLSRFSSCVMLVAYAGYLFFQLKGHHNIYRPVDEGASEAMSMPVAFISVILLPIVGNAAEHASAIMFAMKDKLDITLGVAIGSSTQISMFLIPFCVVIGWIMGKEMDLNFQLFETASLFITVLVVAFMLQEGTANYFKGLMLILCYLIVAASFFEHIDPNFNNN
ncbi:vacuolar cation/proton exchanger 2-like isoform X5 [Phalaenopsis equestris]|uniref:vacuolar cation/proton exchanger 2-like isoform X5 n=1 Tax=Phalaenopsis equestris TaxID=78828 RepID=UPI0009E61607|nr:vacuolar cation/proton exchanger 2-like isoform X5 [Phalaenopsis equestris]